MKRFFLIFIILASFCIDAGAVLKEKDLEQTLTILQAELEQYNNELSVRSVARRERTKRLITQLLQTMKRADQNALMLYSQQQDNVFDLTYACHEATKQFNDFNRQRLPFTDFLEKTERDIARYDSLIQRLESMPDVTMTKYGNLKRDTCLVLAKNINKMLQGNAQQLRRNIRFYNTTERRLKEQNEYAHKRYSEIQRNIFINGGDSYLTLLGHFDRSWKQLNDAVQKKYNLDPESKSQWSLTWILGTFVAIFIYVIIAIVLNQLFFRFLMPTRFRTEEFMKKRFCIIMATTSITFAIIQGAIFVIGTGQNYPFLYMAASLLVEFAWLLGVILTSLLMRVKGDQLGSATRIYSPLIAVGFIVIGCRIILIPNELVNFMLPPVLLICALWQWIVIRRHNQNIPRSDIFYTYISLLVFIASVVCSWMGYTLLAVQVLIWWIMQLTCILTITCVSQYIKLYGERRNFAEAPVTRTWAYDLFYQVILPSLSVGSVMLSIWWAADVFNLSDLCWRAFKYHFVDQDNFQLSIIKLTMVVCLWFLFSYLSKTLLRLLRLVFQMRDPESAESRTVMSKNVIQIIIWGTWVLLSLTVLHISLSWLLYITGGLSAGIGFASKNIIENIFYGASLMTGRIKVGDWIEVNGTMGNVTSISYTSTVIESLYGEIITFQNSQLFTNNYKNLTRNHGYVLAVVPYSVAYGSNLQQVVQLADNAVNQLKHRWMDRSKKAKSVVGELADSGINLKMFVWADAPKKSYVVSDVLNCIYDTLNQHGIEIPFPQQDVHIKQS